jgi:glucose-1-phosphate adenylyltransferase
MMGRLDRVLTVILGGGQGTRLMPLTRNRSKPAVSFGGKYRLVDIPISNCLHANLSKVFVLTQFNSYSLNRHVQASFMMRDFRGSFIEIFAAEQTPENQNWFQGTADAVRQVLPHLMAYDPSHVLILSGDQLYTMDLADLVRSHIDCPETITVATTAVDRAKARGFGIMKTEGTRIAEFVEKPQDEELLDQLAQPDGRYLASMGIYVFKTDVLARLLKQHSDCTDFGREIIPRALGEEPVRAFLHDGFWEDIGTIKSFYDANLMLTKRVPDVELYHPDRPIYTNPRYLPPSRLAGCQVSDSMICDGCYINGARIERSVIGIRSVIGNGAVIEDSVVMGADAYDFRSPPVGKLPQAIGRDTHIRGAILDKGVRIGPDVKLLNEKGLQEYADEHLEIHDGIIVVPRGATIPSGYRI